MQTPTELALEAENKELRRKIEYLERRHGPCETFLGYPVESREMPSPHLDTLTIPKVASWTSSENEYGVPLMIGWAMDRPQRRLEMSFYCTPHPNTAGAFNVLGTLHAQALKQLATMYRKECA